MSVSDRLVSASAAAKRLGVSTRTLRRYTADGTLPDRRSPGGRRVFDPGELDRLAARRGAVPQVSAAVVLYARVSSHRQRAEGDLDRQCAQLRAAAGGRPVVGEFTDVASGLSDKRKGLRRALSACQDGQVTALLVTHPQRLARFGTALLADVVLPSWGVGLEVVGDDEPGSGDGDLMRDMLAVVTSFAGSAVRGAVGAGAGVGGGSEGQHAAVDACWPLLDKTTVWGVGRERRTRPLRSIAAPFVVASPAGVRIRTRLRPTDAEAAVLRQVGEHLGHLYRADLAARVRLGDVPRKDTDRATRKRNLTAHSTSRWAGAITRTAEDQYQLAMRGLRANVDSLTRALATIDARLAAPAQWRERWRAARMFLTADGEAGAPGGNYTITAAVDGAVSIALPAMLRHLANAPRGRYVLAEPIAFTHRGGEWGDRVAANLPVRYDITFDPARGRWYLDASWSIPAETACIDSLAGGRLLGVDLNADHLAAHVIDGHGNPSGPPVTIPLDLTGPASQRDGRLRAAITALIRTARVNGCAAIAVENLGFTDARATGRETMGRGRRGKRFRRTVAGIPTARFRERLAGMAYAAGLPVIAVDPAYTSRWGGQHWRPALHRKTSTATRHHAAAVVIARRAHGHKARRRPGVTRTRPEDRVGRATGQAPPQPVGVWEQPALPETARTTPVDETRPALVRPRASHAPKTVRGAPGISREQRGQHRPIR